MTEDPLVLLHRVLGVEVVAGARARPVPDLHGRALVARAGRADYGRWLAQTASTGGCTRPVRLRGQAYAADTTTGELRPVLDTDELPDAVLYKACGDRRASVCPTCAETYRRDTYQLVRAGLAGGKGVPETVVGHPTVFVTLTAPSFGPVHARRTGSGGRALLCRPRRTRRLCEHGRPLWCDRTHAEDEQTTGQPLCLDCYDHAGQVVWNAHVGELWRRTTIALRRALLRVAKRTGARVRVSYAKVAEFQRRGVVHLHALVRLDGLNRHDPDAVIPPGPGLGADELAGAVRHAVTGTAFGTPARPDRPTGWRITWGSELDIRTVRKPTGEHLTDAAVAAYLAKYATKSTETTGHLSKRLNAATVAIYGDPATHAGRLIRACWDLGAHPEYVRLRRWAHMIGFGGHFSTRSRRYSTTLRALRRARQTWRRRAEHADDTTLVVGTFSYAGSGWHTGADALLAQTAAAQAREKRRTAKEELAHHNGRS